MRFLKSPSSPKYEGVDKSVFKNSKSIFIFNYLNVYCKCTRYFLIPKIYFLVNLLTLKCLTFKHFKYSSTW